MLCVATPAIRRVALGQRPAVPTAPAAVRPKSVVEKTPARFVRPAVILMHHEWQQ